METVIFLFEAFLGGLLVFFIEELFQAAQYSLPTLGASLGVGLLVLSATKRLNNQLTWIASGALIAAFAAILRVGIVYGGYVSLLAGVDCFAICHLHDYTYILFALSGAVAGFVVALLDDGSYWVRPVGILAITLGVLYHLKIAQGWWSASPVVAIPLFIGEFLAPTVFCVALLRLGHHFASKET